MTAIDFHPVSPDDLYGGVFDICVPECTLIDMKLVRSALLFHDAIIIPDGFFWCYGPLLNKLEQEIKISGDDDPKGQIIDLLQYGLCIPQIRRGQDGKVYESLKDVWEVGGANGVNWDQYLIIPKERGDTLFSALHTLNIKPATWPQGMIPGTDTTTAPDPYIALIKKYFIENEGLSSINENIDRILHYHDVSKNCILKHATLKVVADFWDFIATVKVKDEREFRRGQIENHFREKYKLGKMVYDKKHNVSSIETAVIDALLNTSSTIYELHQSLAFQCGASFFHEKDPLVVVDNQPNFSKALDHAASIILSLDYLNGLNVSNLTPSILSALRTHEDHKVMFLRAKALRRSLLQDSGLVFEDDLLSFLEFVSKRYVPYMISQWPELAQNSSVATTMADLENLGLSTGVPGGILFLCEYFGYGITVSQDIAAVLKFIEATTAAITVISAGSKISRYTFNLANRQILARKNSKEFRLIREHLNVRKK